MILLAILLEVGLVTAVAYTDQDDDAMHDGGARLEALQQNDGGWDWPLDDGDPNNASAVNTIGPIATGLARAYWNGGEAAYEAALLDAGGLLLSKTNNFSPSDGYLATILDSVFGGTVYRDHVLANFYDPLAAGTYDRNGAGILYDTASYIASIYASRSSWGGGNLAAWDVGMGLVGAVSAGADPTEWVAGTKTEINRLVEPAWYDVIGLAGALYGLAFAGEEFDPTTGAHAAAGSLGDLADTLAGYQIPGGTGGFTWESDCLAPGNSDEVVQETAYAILALNEVNRDTYLTVIEDAADWLVVFQMGTGGWKNWDGGSENNEVSGEALWGIHTVYVQDIWVDERGNDHAFGYGYIPFETLAEAVAKIGGTNGTIHIGDGTFTLGPGTYVTRLFIEGDANVSGVGATTLVAPGSTSVTFAESSETWDPIVFAYGGTMDSSNHVSGTATIEAQVSGFEIDGQNSAVSGKRFVGILLRNVDGEVSGNRLHDLYDADGKGNGPETFGILVYGDSAIDILNNIITDYSRGGIGIQGDLGAAPDPVATVQGNTVTGNGFEGETGWWADNGIQFGYGASGQIVGNTVTGHWSNSPWGASGIIIASTANVDIIQNLVQDNELGIALVGYSVYGAPYEATDNILVRQNEIIANEYGISLQMDANNTLILMNNVTGNTVGISVADYYGVEAVGTEIHYNSIVGNLLGLENWEVDSDIDASLNWWGALDGPTADLDGDGIPDYAGGGDGIYGNVIFSPWLGSAPDGDLGQWGVQITAPMLIIVAPVGPEPTGGYLNTAIAGANSADLPFTDTIEVRHGTYDGSTPITQPVNIVSEPGSASHTTLNGDMSINGNGVLVGLPLQGFRMNGNVTVGVGNDAGTSWIHWSDLYGNVTNNGTGTFDAQYNYWGTQLAAVIDGRTTGLIDYDPFLPRNADDSYTDIQSLLAAGVAGGIDPAIDQLWLMVQLGQDVSTFIGYSGVAGAGAFGGAPAGASINLGGAAGGGGAVEGAISGTYTPGDPIDGRFTLTDPVTGEPVTDAAVTTSLLGPDGALVFWGCATYDETTGEYVFSIDTSGLAPGTYELIIQTDDGQSKTVSIEVQAA